jgi:hypothetical protein
MSEEFVEEEPKRLSKEEMEAVQNPKKKTEEKKPLQGQDLISVMEKEILFLRGKVEAYEITLGGKKDGKQTD